MLSHVQREGPLNNYYQNWQHGGHRSPVEMSGNMLWWVQEGKRECKLKEAQEILSRNV
jgi:hypothetical protein